MPILLIHNGNDFVLSWAKQITSHVSDYPITHISNVGRGSALLQQNVIIETSVTDPIDFENFYLPNRSKLSVVKVLTSLQRDQQYLQRGWKSSFDNFVKDYNNIKDSKWPTIDHVGDWHDLPDHIKSHCLDVLDLDLASTTPGSNVYNESTWLQATFYGLSLADDIVFLDQITADSDHSQDAIVFTPGRCGTHVLLDITGATTFCHHHDSLIESQQRWQQLVGASKIFAVLRRTLLDQICSDAVRQRYGLVLTTKNTLEQVRSRVQQWAGFEITDKDIDYSLKKICTYVDILLGLKFCFNKDIKFSFLEDLKHHYQSIEHQKNPYDYRTLIVNYEDVEIKCNQIYQAFYDKITNRVETLFGRHLYAV
jgi:hypothetical protein